MNQSYIYNNGKVVVFDQYGNQTTVDYCDNLREVLEQENLIEVMNIKKWHLITKQDGYTSEYENIIKDQRKGLLLIGLLSIGVVAIGLLVPNLLNKPLINSISFILPMLSAIGAATIFGVVTDSKAKKYILEKKENTEENLRNLVKQIELQKQYLEDLEKNKTNTREKDGFSVSKLNGGMTVMQNNETLADFAKLYDYNDRIVSMCHWNKGDDENTNVTSDNIENQNEEKGYTLKKTLR